jgi:hypothetical protein
MARKPCWYCGAIGKCLTGCQCRKCLYPYDYQSWKRNQPGYWEEKARLDRENRQRLESAGQGNFEDVRASRNHNINQYILSRFQKATARAQDMTDPKDLLQFAAEFLREFSRVTQRLTEVVENDSLVES